MSVVNTKFAVCCEKINQLFYSRTEDRCLFSTTLSELIEINYKFEFYANSTKTSLLINQCCSLIDKNDKELVFKFCCLLTNFIKYQNEIIETKTVIIAIKWCLEVLNEDNNAILIALNVLLENNRDVISEVIPDLMTSKIVDLACNSGSKDTKLYAIHCLESCFYSKVENEGTVLCFSIFSDYLLNSQISDNSTDFKILILCLRGLQNIIIQNPELARKNIGTLLGIIRTFMLYKIDNIEFIKPETLKPSVLSIPEPTGISREKKGGKIIKQRKSQNKKSCKKPEEYKYEIINSELSVNLLNFAKISDSDVSDTEEYTPPYLLTAKIRQSALNLFMEVIKINEKSVIFSYWSSFIPENSIVGKHNLITCILRDTAIKCRLMALNVLNFLISQAKMYLFQAENGGHNMSFTPYSVVIGLTIKELHKCLTLAISDNSLIILIQVLKCFAALVQATPYHKLSQGLITKIVRNVKSYVYHKDSTAQVTALIVLGCILAFEPIIPETRRIFIEENGKLPWLLDRCLENLEVFNQKDIPIPVKLESLQLISIMSRNYFTCLIVPFMPLITKAIDWSLMDKFGDVRLHAGKTVDFLGQAMNKYFSDSGPIDDCLVFWETIFQKSLPDLLQSDNSVLKTTGCDCFGSIGPQIFQHLPRDKQILCITLLFNCARDAEGSVKGAAVRALAICVLYPSLREDSGFVADTSEIIYKTLQDDNLAVKIKASWSLGNLSDALVLNSENANIEEFPESLLLKLLQVSVGQSNNNDKIKMNIVRALGSLLQLLNAPLIKKEDFKVEAIKAIDILVNNSKSCPNMKVRWNSCYAIGNILKNPAMYELSLCWQEQVFTTLMELVGTCRNFKVRINAAVALKSPQTRQNYGLFYVEMWSSLLKALENSQNLKDFTEYDHKDHLMEQITLTLAHLTTLLTEQDLSLLNDVILFHFDTFRNCGRKVVQQILPEKSTIFFSAKCHLDSLSKSLTDYDSKNTLHYLLTVFSQEI